MKVLISSIGSRGDVQPILALALQFRASGHDARLCVAPNFKDWVESLGVPCLPIGPDLRQITGGTAPKSPLKPSTEQMRQFAAHSVRAQFPVLIRAAEGCDLIVAGGALQLATRSVAESLKIPYVFVAYCPAVLPSASHPPPKMGTHYPQSSPPETNLSLWAEEEQRWNTLFGDALNEERAKLGLAPVESVQRYIFTDEPWLAADPIIAPPGLAADMEITQTGAWLLHDERSLPDHVEQFLSNGPPPVYFGFGSMRASEGSSRVLVESARELGLRAIISRGWGNLALVDDGTDCLLVDDLPHEKLFPRVALAIHHGGAGTTTAAARAGRGQVIVPHLYDQYYWAHRVQDLGVGVSGPTRDDLAQSTLIGAIRECMESSIATHATDLAVAVETRGAEVAVERLIRQFA